MKSNLDKHIDSTIKNSFESLQRKAPVHLWDNISEQMDTEQTLDDSIDEKVQETYLNHLDKKAPAFLWGAISSDLDEADGLNLDSSIDNKIKQSYTEKLNKKAPAALWGAIAEDLNHAAVQLDKSLDEKVKESYSTQEMAKTPSAVWLGVNRQLNIDRTWNKISKALDVRPVVSDWRNRMIKFLGAASLLLLLVKTCDFNPSPIQTNYQNPSLVEYANNEDDNKLINKKPSDNTNSKDKLALSNQDSDKMEQQGETIKEQVLNQEEKTSEKIVGARTNENLSANNQEKKVTPSNLNPSILQTEKKKDKELAKPLALKATGENANNPNSNQSEIDASKDKTNDKNFLSKGQDIDIEKKNFVDNQQKIAPVNWALLDAINAESLDLSYSTEPIQLLEDIKLEKDAKKKNVIAGKLSAGAFVVVNSTMLLNNETREGFKSNSLTQNYFGLAANYGIWAAYRIMPRGEILAEFSINADNKQAYGVYDQGVYYIKEWVMKYNRVSLAYKYDLWDMKGKKLVNTKIVGQAGLYLGFLREAKLFYDGELFYDALAEHHVLDFGFKVALGQEIIIDKFVLSYGIRSDIGATNIFKGNAAVAGIENQTNVVHIGGYFSLGYKF